eukprot:jgi/Chlat1/8607/Chrsp86S08022
MSYCMLRKFTPAVCPAMARALCTQLALALSLVLLIACVPSLRRTVTAFCVKNGDNKGKCRSS